jgi:hypothetical protein
MDHYIFPDYDKNKQYMDELNTDLVGYNKKNGKCQNL